MSILPYIKYPVAEFELEHEYFTPLIYGALVRLRNKQWLMDFKPIDLDNSYWVKRVTGLNKSQYHRNIAKIKELYRSKEGGYVYIYFEEIYEKVLEVHETNSEKGKKSAEKRRLKKLERENDERNVTIDTQIIPENKETTSVGFEQNKIKQNKRKEKINKITKDTARNLNPYYLEEKEKKGSFRSKQFKKFYLALLKNESNADHIDYLNKIDLLSNQDKEEIGQCYFNNMKLDKPLEKPLMLLESKIK